MDERANLSLGERVSNQLTNMYHIDYSGSCCLFVVVVELLKDLIAVCCSPVAEHAYKLTQHHLGEMGEPENPFLVSSHPAPSHSYFLITPHILATESHTVQIAVNIGHIHHRHALLSQERIASVANGNSV